MLPITISTIIILKSTIKTISSYHKIIIFMTKTKVILNITKTNITHLNQNELNLYKKSGNDILFYT